MSAVSLLAGTGPGPPGLISHLLQFSLKFCWALLHVEDPPLTQGKLGLSPGDRHRGVSLCSGGGAAFGGGTEWGDVGKVLSRKEEGEFMAWLRKLEVILGRLT